MIYEVINPSDKITCEANEDRIAILAGLLLGEGSYGLIDEEGRDVLPILLLATEKQTNEWLTSHDIDLSQTPYEDNTAEIAECLRSMAVCSVSDRKAMLAVVHTAGVAFAKRGRDTAKALAAWNEAKRTSMNDICARAVMLADALVAPKKAP